MKDTNAADAGSLKDITKAKEDADTAVSDVEKEVAAAKTKKLAFEKSVTDTKKLSDDAFTAWDGLKGKATIALTAAKTPLEEVKLLRDAVVKAEGDVKVAKSSLAALETTIKGNQKSIDAAEGDRKLKIVTCEGLKYDTFQTDVATKKSERDSTLKAIEKMIDSRKTFAHGATGGRCEKPQSNGDGLKRGKCTAATDCCGAATGRPNGATGALVTIEVCQDKATKTWGYVGMRPPLAKTDLVAVNWPFLCIGGASQLAGAAAAVLASAYMMA